MVCNQSDAAQVFTNGHYVTENAVAPLVENGGSFIVSMVQVETNQLTTSTIVIPEDVSIGIDFIKYEMDFSGSNKEAVKGTYEHPDFGIYQMQFTDGSGSSDANYYLFRQAINLPAGSYEAESLAVLITDAFSKSAPMKGVQIPLTGNPLLTSTDELPAGGGVVKITFPVPSPLDGGSQAWVGEDTPYGGFLSAAPGQKDPEPKAARQYISPVATSGVGTGLVVQMKLVGSGAVLPNPAITPYYKVINGGEGYALNDTVTFSSDQFFRYDPGDNTYDKRNPAGGTVTFTITSIGSDTDFYEMTPLGQAPKDPSRSYKYTTPYFEGTSEFELAFDTNINKPKFAFLHTPAYTGTVGDMQPAVAFMKDISDNFHTVNRTTGIALVGLEPPSFWRDQLGFDIDNIICKVKNPTTGELETISDSTPNTYPIDVSSFEASTTTSYTGLNSLVNSGGWSNKVPNTSLLAVQTTLTNGIIAADYTAASATKLYFVEIAELGQSVISGNALKSICSVVNGQYASNDVVVADGGASWNFVYRGEPFSLSTLTIKITDALTGEVPDTLGDNNSVVIIYTPPQPVAG